MKGVYQITNKTNGKKYIGSSEDIKKRWGKHKYGLNGGYHKNPHLQNAWNKYGKGAFTFEMLEETRNTLEREQWYLDNAVEWGFDYNICPYVTSGMKGRTLSEEHKRKLSEAATGRKHTEETKRKMSEAHKGKTHTKETRRKLSENHGRGMLSRKHTDEAKRKISEANKGRVVSEETKRKLSEANTGRRHTEEAIRKMSGENSPSSKLTNEQVWQIHTLYATGNYTLAQLGRRFHVCKSHVGYIIRGDSWEHVHDKFQRRKT